MYLIIFKLREDEFDYPYSMVNYKKDLERIDEDIILTYIYTAKQPLSSKEELEELRNEVLTSYFTENNVNT
jgi:hypothetical protein